MLGPRRSRFPLISSSRQAPRLKRGDALGESLIARAAPRLLKLLRFSSLRFLNLTLEPPGLILKLPSQVLFLVDLIHMVVDLGQ